MRALPRPLLGRAVVGISGPRLLSQTTQPSTTTDQTNKLNRTRAAGEGGRGAEGAGDAGGGHPAGGRPAHRHVQAQVDQVRSVWGGGSGNGRRRVGGFSLLGGCVGPGRWVSIV